MSEELKPCPFCGAVMVELERGNYAEHPWSEADDFCHMRGFSVHRSRYGWWNRRASPTPPTTEGDWTVDDTILARKILTYMGEAVENPSLHPGANQRVDNIAKIIAAHSSPRVEDDEKLREIHTFLLGEGPLDGRWFGDAAPVVGKYRQPYWWRTNLRAALSPPDGDGKQKQARPSGSAPISDVINATTERK